MSLLDERELVLDPAIPLPGVLDAGRLEALRSTGLLDSAAEESFDRFTSLAKLVLGIPVALVSLVDHERQFFKSQVGLPEPWAMLRETPLSHSFCQRVVSTKAPLVVVNAKLDPRVMNNLAVPELGVQAYAGLPLTTSDGHTLGAFCVVSAEPREWTTEELRTLQQLAAAVMTEIELRRALRLVSERNALVNAVFRNAALGLVVADVSATILRVNRALSTILGYADGELTGLRTATFAHPDDLARLMPRYESLRNGDIDSLQVETRLRTRAGGYVWTRVTFSTSRDAHGGVELYIATVEEIEEARRTEEALRVTENRYSALVRNVPHSAILSFDHDLRCITADGEELLAKLGSTSAQLLGVYLPDVAMPENAELVAKTYRSTLAGHKHRLEMHRHGYHLEVHTAPVRANDGAVTGGMVMMYDITAMKLAEQSLVDQASAMKLVEDVATAANRARTSEEAFRSIIERVGSHMGWPVGHVYMREGDDLVPSEIWHLVDGEAMKPFVEATRATRFSRGVSLGRILDSAKARWMLDIGDTLEYPRHESAKQVGLHSALAFPVLVGSEVAAVLEFNHTSRVVPDDALIALMASIGMQLGRVVERERFAAEVKTLSLRDELTALLNRRGFMDLGQQRHDLASENGKSFALIFADLNGMKSINDQLGHEAGDRALRDTADILRSVFREVDLVARLGGDEFVVLAVDTEASHMQRLERRIREAIGAFNALGTRPYRLSLSLGTATFDPALPQTLDTLLAEADGGMYAQKRARRAAGANSVAPSLTRQFG